MEIDQLRELFEGIRDENRRYANTATRIGNAFLALLSYVGSFSSDKYLRKDIPDFTNFLVKFLPELSLESSSTLCLPEKALE